MARPYIARRRSPNPPASRARIIAAVRELLAEGAFHSSSVEDVAARAGVSLATVYQQFGSRLGLVDVLCETFDANEALVSLRAAVEQSAPEDALDTFLVQVVRFWASEEAVLAQLYGVAAVDPAAAALVERQRADRRGELRRLLARLGRRDDARALALLLVLTSFETFTELRRHARLSEAEVKRTLQESARALLAPAPS